MKPLHLLLSGTFLWAALWAPAHSADIPYSEDVAVIIGNKSYEDSDIPAVLFAHNDAQAVRQFAQDVLKIRNENIIYMEDATQAKMQSAFGRRGNYRGKAFQYVKPGVSNLYVFYSGHGLPGSHDHKSYLLPVDAEIETAEINGYPTDLLYENLRQIGAKSITVLLDACFSGSSHAGSLIKNASGASVIAVPTPTPLPQNETEKNTATTPDTLTVLTAASRDQLASWDEENKHGLFTEYLLRALYGEADRDGDGTVRLEEVSTFLNEDMRYKARRTYNRDQTPTIMGNEERIMVAAVEGIYPARPKSLAPKDEPIDPPVIDTSAYELYPVEQNMFALKNANVRLLPTVRAPKVMTLPKGEPIHVAAKIIDQPWYAVERGDGIIGYVFADLLGEEKEIATEEENRSIRELKARLEKLEQQTQLSTQDVLPQPPEIEERNPEIVERIPAEPAETDKDPLDDIEATLKSMGAILARQNFIESNGTQGQKTSFAYNWIRVEAGRCQLRASISLFHNDPRGNKSVRIHDRQVQATFARELSRKKRTLDLRDHTGRVDRKLILYHLGPFTFKEKQDRRLFAAKAKHLQDLCAQPRQAQYIEPEQSHDFRRPPPPPPPFKRPPPPPRHKWD